MSSLKSKMNVFNRSKQTIYDITTTRDMKTDE